jgi:hypothetical protein
MINPLPTNLECRSLSSPEDSSSLNPLILSKAFFFITIEEAKIVEFTTGLV